ncbi:FadR/GntR family transcriptional regulator [Aestuariispira ectoiniformans]|uniref:FadR/GntR family transcriptional regulator n=1 Tax=Aestuariispira ectoiniformans TaxID=2775080 RepID=UPI00223C0CC1|nr:FCD domain-containing protein [Aestuariispira ectoiniformans]
MTSGEATLGSGMRVPQKRKRSDMIAEEIKRWIIAEHKVAGERLPQERDLAALFDCAKGTLREALKSLEVQGLINVRTGPNGGAVLAEVSYDRSTELLRNYMHFQNLTVEQVYEFRKAVEVEMAVSVVGHLDEEAFARLEESVGCCACSGHKESEQMKVRQAELDFHVLLAQYCPNPLLSFHSRFISDLLRDFIRLRTDVPDAFDKFTTVNRDFHRQLIDALRREDREAVGRLMREHMELAERFTLELEGVVSENLMLVP